MFPQGLGEHFFGAWQSESVRWGNSGATSDSFLYLIDFHQEYFGNFHEISDLSCELKLSSQLQLCTLGNIIYGKDI